MKKKLILVVFWISIIYLFSQDTSSSIHTRKAIENISEFLSLHFSISSLNYIIRKGAHITEFFILSFLLYSFLGKLDMKKIHMILLTSLFSLNIAFLDEIHQLYIPGRTGRLNDVFIDFIGVFIFLLFILCFKKKVER